jgi:hypothetical protein
MMEALSEAASSERRRPQGGSDDHSTSTGGHRLAAQIRTVLGVLSLHAETEVAACDRQGLERLLRYGARSAFAHKRLSWTDSGKISYRLRKPYFTRQTEIAFEPVAFLRRLAALIPPKGQNQVRYYGALANRSRVREKVAGFGLRPTPLPKLLLRSPGSSPSPTPTPSLICPTCGGPGTIIAAVTDLDVAATILDHSACPPSSPSSTELERHPTRATTSAIPTSTTPSLESHPTLPRRHLPIGAATRLPLGARQTPSTSNVFATSHASSPHITACRQPSPTSTLAYAGGADRSRGRLPC